MSFHDSGFQEYGAPRDLVEGQLIMPSASKGWSFEAYMRDPGQNAQTAPV